MHLVLIGRSERLSLTELAIGDGALGFWTALEEEFGSTRQQRCWVHKTMNVLNKLPKLVPEGGDQCNPKPKQT
jgi:transposase-like protein